MPVLFIYLFISTNLVLNSVPGSIERSWKAFDSLSETCRRMPKNGMARFSLNSDMHEEINFPTAPDVDSCLSLSLPDTRRVNRQEVVLIGCVVQHCLRAIGLVRWCCVWLITQGRGNKTLRSPLHPTVPAAKLRVSSAACNRDQELMSSVHIIGKIYPLVPSPLSAVVCIFYFELQLSGQDSAGLK